MACPRGQVFNPQTLRCIRATGRMARNLVRRGVLDERNIGFAQQFAPEQLRQTVRRGRTANGVFVARNRGRGQVQFDIGKVVCPPGKARNPRTGRCIKVGGRLYKDVRREEPVAVAAAPDYYAPPQQQQPPYPYPYPYPYYGMPPPPPPQPPRQTQKQQQTRVLPAGALPVGETGVAPAAEVPEALAWTVKNCRNYRDPITGKAFNTLNKTELQDVIRLHTGDCVSAEALSERVGEQHRANKTATLPDTAETHMELDDFRVMRDAIRRRKPAYKIPGRRHQPPPAEWQLYIASDARSGPQYLSVAYVDTTRGVVGYNGAPQYPKEAIRVDLGFIPILRGEGLKCSMNTVISFIEKLAAENKLLHQVGGGWRPMAGFPYAKGYWEEDTAKKFNRFCMELVRRLGSPL